MSSEDCEFEWLQKKLNWEAEQHELEMKRIRRDFWINILTGGLLLFLAMICLEIVT